MIKRLLGIILLLVGCISCIQDNVGESVQYVQPGDELPEFSVQMNDGTILDRHSLMGKVSVLVFFHTGCPDCQRELPVVQELYEHYQGDDRVLIACISREEPADEVAAYWQQQGVTLPYSAQPDRRVYALFSEAGVPLVYVSDTVCQVRYLFTDDPTATYVDLYEAVSSLFE